MQTIIKNGLVFNIETNPVTREVTVISKKVKATANTFKPVINLWSAGIQEAIIAGDLVLQPGQYVQCGEGGATSRYIAHCSRTGAFDVVHGGTAKQVAYRFKSRMEIKKEVAAQVKMIKEHREQKKREMALKYRPDCVAHGDKIRAARLAEAKQKVRAARSRRA